jgi:hypothetical protein
LRRSVVFSKESYLTGLMDPSELLQQLSRFLREEEACRLPLQALSPNAEIEVSVAGAASLHVRPGQGEPRVEMGPGRAPDFVFTATPEAIGLLISESGLSPGALAVKLVKEMLNQQVRVAMPVSFLMIPRKGYLNLIKLGGSELFQELRKHQLASLPEILAALRKLRG